MGTLVDDRPTTSDAAGAPLAEERPRERLARHGAAALSSAELVALLLGTGAAGAPALELAGRLIERGVRDLAQRTLLDLESERGVGRAKASRILAALELG